MTTHFRLRDLPGADSAGIALESDACLVHRARAGEPVAFGLLYLRHHQAAWRMANAVAAFTGDRKAVVEEALTVAVCSAPCALAVGASLRPHVLASVRRVALDRNAADAELPVSPGRTGSAETAGSPGDVVVAGVEPVARDAFRLLPEAQRTAWWLIEIEAFTPREAATLMGLRPDDVAGLAARAGSHLRNHVVRMSAAGATGDCRRLAELLAGDVPGDVDAALSRHVEHCIPCGMRRSETAGLRAVLRDAVPPAPPLARPCRRRWQAAMWSSRGGRRRPAILGGGLLVAMLTAVGGRLLRSR